MFEYQIAITEDGQNIIRHDTVKGHRLSPHLAARRKGKGLWKIDHLPTGCCPSYRLIPGTLAMLRERALAAERAMDLNRQRHEFKRPTDGSPWFTRDLFARLQLFMTDPNAPQVYL